MTTFEIKYKMPFDAIDMEKRVFVTSAWDAFEATKDLLSIVPNAEQLDVVTYDAQVEEAIGKLQAKALVLRVR